MGQGWKALGWLNIAHDHPKTKVHVFSLDSECFKVQKLHLRELLHENEEARC